MHMSEPVHTTRMPRVSARLRLALSYALFLVAAGFVMLVGGVYAVLRYVPHYMLIAPNRSAPGTPGASRQELLEALISRQELLEALIRVSGLILFALAVIGISGGWFLAGWILRPLQHINEAAGIAATGRLDHRIRLTSRNDEFRQLADTVDHMLERLHDAFTMQERFASNASHELRTPLAVNATLLDVARKHPDLQDYATLIERLSVTNARAIGLTEALLRLADANSITAVSEPVDLATIVRKVIDESGAEAEQACVSIDTGLDAAPTIGDPVLLEQLATNLIQNAIHHNHSPGAVLVTTRYDPQRRSVVFRVLNTGDLYTHDQVARFREPFLRGVGRVNQPGGPRGYGLGLALVARIISVHDGTLDIAPRDDGGLTVAVTLPCRTYARTTRRVRSRRRRFVSVTPGSVRSAG